MQTFGNKGLDVLKFSFAVHSFGPPIVRLNVCHGSSNTAGAKVQITHQRELWATH